MMILIVVRNVIITGINKETNGSVAVVMMGQNGMRQQNDVGEQQETNGYLFSHAFR